MTKETYFRIRRELRFDPQLWVSVLVLATDGLILACASPGLLNGYAAPSFWIANLLFAVVYFHHFAILHEAGHGNVDSASHRNSCIGHYASIFCFLPFFPWKYIHHEHHTWTGNIDRDPTLHQLRKMKETGRVPWLVRFAWRSWIPFGGLLQHTVFWLYPLRRKLSSDQQRKSAFSVVFLIAVYGLLGLFGPAWLSPKYLWPSLVFYLAAVELVNFPHHLDMPTEGGDYKLAPWEQQVTTRSCNYGIFSAILVLNFNLHTEHHLYPTLPWYRLHDVRNRVRPLMPDYHEERGIAWNLRNRARNAAEMILSRRPARTTERHRDAA
jgi:acyl-lipid omega-6 desaturase (Delta-12 desaturase)